MNKNNRPFFSSMKNETYSKSYKKMEDFLKEVKKKVDN